MRKSKSELIRLQNLIENDRLNMGDNFQDLIVADLHKILSDYFEYRGLPLLEINKNSKKLSVVITLDALAVKNFLVLPKNR